jgi:penicillin-binding protein 2
VLVTPLQIAAMMAALRNGGTLYRPQLVQRIAPPGGAPAFEFQPIVNGQLPLTAGQLQAIRQGLRAVTSEPGGTARHRFLNLGVPVAGKTGTAQNSAGLPHSWFAGYTEAEQLAEADRPERPDIAGVIIVENGGEGSDVAAPLFRRIVELYFFGRPSTLLPWETDFGVAGTPTPGLTPTPNP